MWELTLLILAKRYVLIVWRAASGAHLQAIASSVKLIVSSMMVFVSTSAKLAISMMRKRCHAFNALLKIAGSAYFLKMGRSKPAKSV